MSGAINCPPPGERPPPAKGRRRWVSMPPPMDRDNKLQLRAEYYRVHTRENFDRYYG
jgi:hypothetical protein